MPANLRADVETLWTYHDMATSPCRCDVGIGLARPLLADHGITPRTVMVISKPYMERRAFATCQLIWPIVEVVCTSEPLKFADYTQEE